MARTARQRAALKKAQLASARKRRGKGKGKLASANRRNKRNTRIAIGAVGAAYALTGYALLGKNTRNHVSHVARSTAKYGKVRVKMKHTEFKQVRSFRKQLGKLPKA